MTVVVTLQDLVNQIADFNQNYTTSTIDMGNVVRAANRAVEFVQRRLGLPSDRKIFSFNFYQDIKTYTVPSDFSEYIQLYYDTTNASVDADHNQPNNRWFSFEDTEINRSTGQYQYKNRVAFTTANGSSQMLLDGRNLHQPTIVDSCDQTSNFTISTSITGATTDSNIYKQGSASIVFNVLNTESTSTITFPQQNLDIRQALNSNGAFRIFVYFPTGVDTSILSSIKLVLQSSTGNYYTVTTTTDYLGNAWASNSWSLLSFPLNTAVTTGTPNAASITTVQLQLVHAGGFTSFSNMRIDYLYQVRPDLMDLSYYSAIKGTDTTGATQKVLLDNLTDKLAFAAFAPDLIYPIALKAALILWPQLRADPNFMATYKQDFNEAILLYGKTYPRKRNPNAAATQLAR